MRTKPTRNEGDKEMATKIENRKYGRHTLELWDRHNGEFVIRQFVKASKTNAEFMKDREYTWVYYDLRDAQDCFKRLCSSVNRGYVCLCPH